MSITTSSICQRIRCREYEYLVTQTIEALNRKEFGYDIYAKANLSLILLLANQASVTKPVRLADITPQAVKDAIQYVDQNLSNTLSIQDIADHLNLSRSRFCHLFKGLYRDLSVELHHCPPDPACLHPAAERDVHHRCLF